jgi:hypothetical protein
MREDSRTRARKTLRKLHAPVWKRWTPVEPADNNTGAVSEKGGNGALREIPHNPRSLVRVQVGASS